MHHQISFQTRSESSNLAITALKSLARQYEQTIVYWIYQLTTLTHSHIVFDRSGYPVDDNPGRCHATIEMIRFLTGVDASSVAKFTQLIRCI